MDKQIRAKTVERSMGHCDACGKFAGESAHYDHAFGRRCPEALEAGWMLCVRCDYEKTHNHPSAQHWIRTFIAHCEKHGYGVSLERSKVRLQVQVTKFGER